MDKKWIAIGLNRQVYSSSVIRTYYQLTKPGIILGNLITMTAGFALAAQGMIDYRLLLPALSGLGLIIASACVFNNYIDRDIDRKMARTRKRALVAGLISGPQALVFGTVLGVLGTLVLAIGTNPLALTIALCGFFVYVVLYGIWKRRSVYGTVVGSLSGAVPPVVGYCAVSNRLDSGALIFFLILVLWQMPHFFAIAIYRLKDYAAAGIPVLPVKKGIENTKVNMVLYIVAFLLATLMLTAYGYTGPVFLSVVSAVGLAWLGLCLQGLRRKDHERWARSMFRFSLVVITTLCVSIPVDAALR